MSALICGSFAYDTIMRFPDSFKRHILGDQLDRLNVCFMVPEMRREFGGCAGNIGFNLKLLGVEPLLMGTVGKDAEAYLAWLDKNRLEHRYVQIIEDAFTAQAFITTDADDNQITAFHPGAMAYAHTNSVTDVSTSREDLCLGMIAPDGRDGMLQHAQQFVDAGIPFIFDPGQGLPMFQADELRRFFAQASWIIVNDYEWQMMQEFTGMGIEEVAAQVEALIITRGAAGSLIHSEGQCYEIAATKPSQLADPTGCGDAYRAGLVYGLIHNMDWQTIGQIASLMGTIKIESQGAQNHTLTMDEFRARYQSYFGATF